jgi:anti-sigma regulatory factor (Ser/Thr protein kinase)
LSNLLDNARRYTPTGGAITIDVRRDGGTAEVTVTDSGPGFPTTNASGSSNAWCAWTPGAAEITAPPGWASPSPER